MKISRGGVEWACLWHIPMFRFPGVKRGDGVFSSCFGTCCLYFEGGVEGGVVGCKVATLGMMLLAMVLMLAGVAKPGQC